MSDGTGAGERAGVAGARRWLFVTAHFPWPITQGLWLRVYHLARSLSELGEDVSLLTTGDHPEGVMAYTQAGVRLVEGPATPHETRKPRGRPLEFHAYDRRLAQAIERHAPQFDVVVFASSVLLHYAKEASAAGCLVVDYVDDPVRTRLSMLAAASGSLDWLVRALRLVRLPLLRWFEARFLDCVELVTFVSDEDCATFARRHPRQPVAIAPNGVDIGYFQRAPVDSSGPDPHPTITFSGIMRHPPNEDAAKTLVREIGPRIWETLPNARIVIVGAEPTAEVLALAGPRVDVTGRVEDIRPYICRSDVVLLPMTSGTGIKNKLLEAWASGVAVVATPLACQGIPAVDGENLLLGSGPEELAAAALRLLQDPELRAGIAAGGRRTVEARQTWPLMAERLRSAVAAVAPAGDRVAGAGRLSRQGQEFGESRLEE